MTKVQHVLAENIRKFRKLHGFTQEQLAEKAGTSTNYIGTIEIGKKYPSPMMIERLAEALEIDSLMFFQNGVETEITDLNNNNETIRKINILLPLCSQKMQEGLLAYLNVVTQ